VDNEFAELYDMFGRMMGHLSDTRAQEGEAQGEEGAEAEGLPELEDTRDEPAAK
jgi:hypothetical protein